MKKFPFVGTLLWVLLASVFCWQQSPLLLSICCAGLGAFLGSYLAHSSRDKNLNAWRLWPLGIASLFGFSWFIDFLRWIRLPSFILGGAWTYSLTDALFWGGESLLLVFLLRWTSTAKPFLLGLELLVAGGSLVELFAAHRHGFVNRPYAIVDPLWSNGIDPLPVFLVFGVLIGLLILALGASHSPKRGRWFDVIAVSLLVSGLFLFAPTERLKELQKPPETNQKQSETKDFATIGGGGSQNNGGKQPQDQGGADGDSKGPNGQGGQGEPQTGDGDGSSGQGTEQGQSQQGQGDGQTQGQQNQGEGQSQGGQGQDGSQGQQGQQGGQGGSGDQQGQNQQSGQDGGQGNQSGDQLSDEQGNQGQGQGQDQNDSQGSSGGQEQGSEQGQTGDEQSQGGASQGGENSQSGGTPQNEGQPQGQGQDQPSDGNPQSGNGEGQSQNQDQQDSNQNTPPQDQSESESSGRGGNSDDLSFQDQGGGGQNPPIAVVVFRDDYNPDTGMYYFRQNAFSQFNGTKLVADTSGLYDLDIAKEFPGKIPVEPKTPEFDDKVFRKLETRVALLTDHAKPFGITNPIEWRAVNNPDPKRFQKAFEVSSMVLDKSISEVVGRKAGDPSWDEKTWEHYTAAPDDPRYKKLLEEIVAKYPDAPQDDPLIKALMVKLWLEEEGTYSLKSTHESSETPTEDFLFGDRTGYCVFFAHAACYLYRTAGMPARTGSGYAVEASQRGNGSSLLIPGQSAHSWPEVYIEGMGWVVLDISPSRSLDPPPSPADPGLQQMLGEMARQNPNETPPDPVEEKLDIQQLLKGIIKAIASALPYALLALVILAYLKKAYRRYEPNLCPEQDLPDATLRSLLDLLADGGHLRDQGEPREVFARRMKDISPSFYRLTQAHLETRLGDPKSAPGFPWKKTFLDARYEIKQACEWHRLLRGMLNPISWMKVH